MIQLSSPRDRAVIENWPSGKHRVTALFESQTNKRGTRIRRTTTGKPKATNYYTAAVLVDGDDGRTYVLALTAYEQIVLIPGTLKGTQYFNDGDDEYEIYKPLLLAA